MNEFLEQISSLSPQRLALLAVKLKEQLDSARRISEDPIAVIGIGCRVPGASNPAEFWEMLDCGREGIREVPSARWPIDEYYDPDQDAPGMMSTRAGGFLDEIDKFDPAFFGIAPREATSMDPQQRLILEVAWEALENANISPSSLVGSKTGVYLGICATDYLQMLLARGETSLDGYLASGNALSVGAGRLSYVLGLQGPCMTIDTSCSASLVSIHQACQSLRLGESSLALAGGVNLICGPEITIALSKGHMLAKDGRCKTFDAAADGFARGEGCGIVVLKRLSDAKRDGDRILALIRGSAINQDGKSGGLTVPNGGAQEAVIRDALAVAGLKGSDIDYVEAHGTGTPLGDPIEVRALARALGEERDPDRPLLIGSVKTNIGHLESAAGVAGFIKVVLSLENQAIPKHLNFKEPNAFIEWASLPVAVVDGGKPWVRGSRPRRAGVSSFGFSGTNAHLILEEAPPEAATVHEANGVDRPLHCLTISAQSEASLSELTRLYADMLTKQQDLRLADVAHAAATGRSHLKNRMAIVAADSAEAQSVLMTAKAGGADPRIRRGKVMSGQSTEVVFLYTGAGAQYPGMGHELYQTSPVFRDAIDYCDRQLGPDAKGRTLKSVLWETAEGEPAIHEIGWTQPAMFAIEYALTTLWRSWGVTPAAVIGHSVGEYAAACAAGVFSVEEGLRLIAERGRIMQSLPPGGMMAALFAPIEEIEAAIALMRSSVSIAAINAPGTVVISGEASAVESVLADFAKRNVIGQRLFVSLAAHSPLMDPALDRMEAAASSVAMSPPSIPISWNLTGRSLPNGVAPDALYWRRHMREPVRFADGIKALHDDGFKIFLEVGPHPTLLAFTQQSLAGEGNLLLTSLRRGKNDWNELLTSLGDLHVNGVPVDFAAFDSSYQRRRVSIPTYAFDRKRYWAPPAVRKGRRGSSSEVSTEITTGEETADLYYDINWEPLPTASGYLRRPLELKDEACRSLRELADQNDFAVYDRSRAEFDRLAVGYICNALNELGFDRKPGRRFNAASEAQRLGIADRHSRLFGALIAVLARRGLFAFSDSSYVVSSIPASDPAALAADLVGRFPEVNAELEILRRCGAKLAQVLTGKEDPLTLLFDGSGFEHVRKLYAESPFSRTFNGALAGLLRKCVRTDARRPLRILEVGAGTGGTTRYILQAIGNNVEYMFTDVSPVLVAQARDQFGNDERVSFAVLDVERSPVEQGFRAGSYDIVIASNAVHATDDIQRSMQNIGSLLAPSGLFAAIEGLAPEIWINITFGLTEGWWRSVDHQRRPDGPLLNAAGWRDLLPQIGFSDVVIASDNPSREGDSRQGIIFAGWAKKPRKWVILSGGDDLARELKASLTELGELATVVDEINWRSEIGSLHAATQPSWIGSGTSDENIEIVYLGGLGGLEGASEDATVADFEFLRHAAKAKGGKLWLVTKGAIAVRDFSDVKAPEQAVLWGLGRTFARENPTLWGGLIDLDPFGNTLDAVDAIVSSIRAGDGEDQVAWRDGVRKTARLVPQSAPVPARPFSVHGDRSYLITGGLGGIGLQVAAWLADNGATHLVVTGRTALPSEGRSAQTEDRRVAAVSQLRERGVTVCSVAVDVGDPDAMTGMMSRFGNEWPQLGGIVHAAIALTHSTLAEMSSADFLSMMRTKVKGAQLLHSLSKSMRLDFLVNFSSCAALLGQVEYAHYAGANAALDALACQWSAQGYPTLSVNWGAWEQMWSLDDESRKRIARAGLNPMPAPVALRALGHLLAAGSNRAIVADIDHLVLRDVYESRGVGKLLHKLSDEEKQERSQAPRSARQDAVAVDFSSLPRLERSNAISEKVRYEVAQVLGLADPSSIDPGKSFFEIGLDSLMALELRRRLFNAIGVNLPPAVAFNHPNLTALSRLLDDSFEVREASAESRVELII